MKNAFYLILKALFVLKIFKFLSKLFCHEEKQLFLDVKNYIGLGLIYAPWWKSMGCKLQKLMFPYEWLDSHAKLTHVDLVSYDDLQ